MFETLQLYERIANGLLYGFGGLVLGGALIGIGLLIWGNK